MIVGNGNQKVWVNARHINRIEPHNDGSMVLVPDDSEGLIGIPDSRSIEQLGQEANEEMRYQSGAE